MNMQPICYSDVDSILEAMRKRTSQCSPEDITRVARFLRHNKSFEEGEADYAASLIILEGSDRRHIRANLNVSPDIQTLPTIKRTGTSSPSMRGYLLGFESDFVTDPDLQRAKSLFMTKEAAIQERADLLFRIFKMFIEGNSLIEKEIKEYSTHPNLVNELFRLIKKASELMTSQSGKEDFIQELSKYLSGSGVVPPIDMREYVSWQFRKLLENQASEKEIFDIELLKNLITALFLALYDRELYYFRHLGEQRLRLIFDRGAKHMLYNLVIQGAGDLSMNQWNLAFYHNRQNEPSVVIPENEPYSSRKYNCLVVWKDSVAEVINATNYIAGIRLNNRDAEKPIGVSLGRDLSITELRFSRGNPFIQFPKDHPNNLHLNELVEFAIYGKLILRDGEIITPDEVIDEFQDIRHVFALPNLNPLGYSGFPKEAANEIEIWVKNKRQTTELNERIQKRIQWIEDWEGEFENYVNRASSNSSPSSNLSEDNCEPAKSELYQELERVFINHLQEVARDHERRKQAYWAEVAEEISQRNYDAQLLERDPASQFLVRHFSELRYLLYHPRHLFGQLQRTDVWLLEHALLKDRSLRHLACSSAIGVDLVELGAPKNWITLCLLRTGYQLKQRLHEVREGGDFAWDESDHPRLVIRLRMNTYPCTIIGIGSLSNNKDHSDALYLLAWGHDFRRGNHTIWDCANVLKAAGARYALVMDEGQDVFQCHLKGEIPSTPISNENFVANEKNYQPLDNWMPVPLAFKLENGIRKLNRRGLRASLAFWQEESAQSSPRP